MDQMGHFSPTNPGDMVHTQIYGVQVIFLYFIYLFRKASPIGVILLLEETKTKDHGH